MSPPPPFEQLSGLPKRLTDKNYFGWERLCECRAFLFCCLRRFVQGAGRGRRPNRPPGGFSSLRLLRRRCAPPGLRPRPPLAPVPAKGPSRPTRSETALLYYLVCSSRMLTAPASCAARICSARWVSPQPLPCHRSRRGGIALHLRGQRYPGRQLFGKGRTTTDASRYRCSPPAGPCGWQTAPAPP